MKHATVTRCAVCQSNRLEVRTVEVEGGSIRVGVCPTCDRVRCVDCKQPIVDPATVRCPCGHVL